MTNDLTRRLFGARTTRISAEEAAAAREIGDKLARRDVGLPDRMPDGFTLNGGYQAPAPAAAKTEREVSADHDKLVADLLRGTQQQPLERSW